MTDLTLSSLAGLAGKRALVVGGGLGIGRAVVNHLGAEGAIVAVLDVEPTRAEGVVSEIRAAGGSAVAIAADVTQPGAGRTSVGEAVSRLGDLDILVNIIGRGRALRTIDLTTEIQMDVLALNYLHHLEFSCEFARHCIGNRKPGSVTMVSSMAGLVPFPQQAAYGAAKAALNSMAASMALEWGPQGIRVNTVAPGIVRTDRNTRQTEADTRMAAAIPMGRVADQDEVARAVLFLASDLASYITGQTLVLDGGATLSTSLGTTV